MCQIGMWLNLVYMCFYSSLSTKHVGFPIMTLNFTTRNLSIRPTASLILLNIYYFRFNIFIKGLFEKRVHSQKIWGEQTPPLLPCSGGSETPLSEPFFNKVADLKVCNFIKKRLQHRCFPVNIVKFFKNSFFNKTPPMASSYWICNSITITKSTWCRPPKIPFYKGFLKN